MTTVEALDKLRSRCDTLAVAESCTGGLLAAEIVSVPGCSDIFLEGIVAYSNAAKTRRLSVPVQLLREHGAVSREVAEAMARGCAETSGASVALATTGIAGPDGGTADKPVGSVWVAVYMGGNTRTEFLHIKCTRDEVRRSAVQAAINLLAA
jgi:nicotinamide-nucleotide amidase